jgi:hypothetical protein
MVKWKKIELKTHEGIKKTRKLKFSCTNQIQYRKFETLAGLRSRPKTQGDLENLRKDFLCVATISTNLYMVKFGLSDLNLIKR